VGDYRTVYNCAITLGRVLARMNQYFAADGAWSEALTLAAINGDKRREGLALLNMAMLDQRRGNHVRALDILEKVYDRMEDLKEWRLLAVCYSRMAFSEMQLNRPDAALVSILNLEDMAERLEDAALQASVHFRRGSIYLKQDEFSKALPEFERAKGLFDELGDKKNVMLTDCYLARTCLYLGRDEEARFLLAEADGLHDVVDSAGVASEIQLVRAEMAAYRKDRENVIPAYEKGLSLAEEADNEEQLLAFHESITYTLLRAGRNLLGLKELLRKAHKSYIRLGMEKIAEDTERWLSEIP